MKTTITIKEKEKMLKNCKHYNTAISYEGTTLDKNVYIIERCTSCGEVVSSKKGTNK
jgi:hypothetical protein